MLSVLFASAVFLQPEPKLEWSTFGDFAAKQFEGSEYRLVMDREIGERPIVYYFPESRTEKLELLKRTCKELCLNYDVDDKLKKIFISGPNSEAGRNLHQKLVISLTRLQQMTHRYWNLTTSEIDDMRHEASLRETHADDPVAASDAILEQELAVYLKNPTTRALLSVLTTLSPSQLATAVLKGNNSSSNIALSASAQELITDSYQGALSGETSPDKIQQQQLNEALAVLNDGGEFLLSGSANSKGEIKFILRVVSDQQEVYAAALTCIVPITQPDIAEMYSGVNYPQELELIKPDLKHKFGWDINTLNVFQSIGVQKKWNTVAWLDTNLVYPNADQLTISTQMSMAPMLRFAAADKGWLVPYSTFNRYPIYSGNWSGIIKAYKMLKPLPSRDELLTYYESLTDAEMVGMPSNPDIWVCQSNYWMLLYPRLVKAALLEAEKRGVKEFDLPIRELSVESGSEIARFWLETNNVRLKRRGLATARAQARFSLQEREVKDAETPDEPAKKILRIVVEIPNALKSLNGTVSNYKLDCEVQVAKE